MAQRHSRAGQLAGAGAKIIENEKRNMQQAPDDARIGETKSKRERARNKNAENLKNSSERIFGKALEMRANTVAEQ